MNIEKYCKTNLLDVKIKKNLLYIEDMVCHIVDLEEVSGGLIDEEFMFNSIDGVDESVTHFLYEFGGRWYLQNVNSAEVDLEEFKYIGLAKQTFPMKSFLGIHSGYELMNGVGVYDDWIRKAKFLQVETLGICEKHTLAGAIIFQNKCRAAGIKSIIGMTIEVQNEFGDTYDLKAYARDFQGWQKLLKFNYIINVDGMLTIPESFVEANRDGLYLVLDPKTLDFDKLPNFGDFYQVDTPNYLDMIRKETFLDNLEKYVASDVPPIFIQDAYYLEQEDYLAREFLWQSAKKFDDRTNNQYFKNKTQILKEIIPLFEKDSDGWKRLFKAASKNEDKMVSECSFVYDTNTRHLPKYKMTADEKLMYKSNTDMFLSLIKKGFKDRDIKNSEKYLARLKEEIRILKKGDVIDYFLVLYDIIQFANRENILIGIGRGSAGGSLVSYLLGIIQIDPLEFDLLFERFLNDGRMGMLKDFVSYSIHTEDGQIDLIDGTVVKILRDGVELTIFVNEVEEGDDLISY